MKFTSIVFVAATLLAACGAQNPSDLTATSSLNIQGEKAAAIVHALEASTVSKSTISGGYQIRVNSLKCTHVPRGFVLNQCSFQDTIKSNADVTLIDGNAFTLMNALMIGGVPSKQFSSVVTLKSLTCTSGGFAPGYSCAIEL